MPGKIEKAVFSTAEVLSSSYRPVSVPVKIEKAVCSTVYVPGKIERAVFSTAVIL